MIFLLTKLRLNRDGKNLVQEAQVAAIKAASLDATDKIAENGFSKESEGNPVQQILRRNSSVSMKHCPYTIDENVIFDCPCCFAKVAVSAWHFGDKLSRTGGGCFFTLRKRMGTLLDISEDIQQVSQLPIIGSCCHAPECLTVKSIVRFFSHSTMLLFELVVPG